MCMLYVSCVLCVLYECIVRVCCVVCRLRVLYVCMSVLYAHVVCELHVLVMCRMSVL